MTTGSIYGTGVDLTTVARIATVHARHTKRFVTRLLHPAERTAIRNVKDPARFLAKAFAAKEAFVKALGTGFRGIAHSDVGLRRDKLGRPELVFSPALKRRLGKLGVTHSHVSLSDEGDLVCAMVVLEK